MNEQATTEVERPLKGEDMAGDDAAEDTSVGGGGREESHRLSNAVHSTDESHGNAVRQEYSEWKVHPRLTPRKDSALQVDGPGDEMHGKGQRENN